MTATNHALTGALIGFIVGQPLLALPLALASHFVCDALPHFGPSKPANWIKTKEFKRLLTIDASMCVLLVAILAGLHPIHWLLASICAFVATSPDLLWLDRFIKAQRGKRWKPSAFDKFASGIQWFEKPIGAVVEAVWLVVFVGLLAMFVK